MYDLRADHRRSDHRCPACLGRLGKLAGQAKPSQLRPDVVGHVTFAERQAIAQIITLVQRVEALEAEVAALKASRPVLKLKDARPNG